MKKNKSNFDIGEEFREKGDMNNALKYYLLAADEGDGNAMNNVAVIYQTGATGRRNDNKAIEYYTKAAKAKCAHSAHYLFNIYYQQKNKEKIVETLNLMIKNSIKREEGDLAYDIGLCFYFGTLGIHDYDLAYAYFEKAVQKGYEDYYYMAQILIRGLSLIHHDEKLGVKYLVKGVEAGQKDSALDLAEFFYRLGDKERLDMSCDICKKMGITDIRERLEKHAKDPNYNFYVKEER